MEPMGTVPVDYHQFYIGDVMEAPFPWADTSGNGLVGVSPHSLYINTGIAAGPVGVDVHVLASAPTDLDAGDWEDIVEASIEVPSGDLGFAALGMDVDDEFPVLSPAGPGTYRIRVHARGRDANYDGVVMTEEYENEDDQMMPPDPIIERYLFQVWPAPVKDIIVLRLESERGKYDASLEPAPHREMIVEGGPFQTQGLSTSVEGDSAENLRRAQIRQTLLDAAARHATRDREQDP